MWRERVSEEGIWIGKHLQLSSYWGGHLNSYNIYKKNCISVFYVLNIAILIVNTIYNTKLIYHKVKEYFVNIDSMLSYLFTDESRGTYNRTQMIHILVQYAFPPGPGQHAFQIQSAIILQILSGLPPCQNCLFTASGLANSMARETNP
jgi:hypothetical protein